MWRPTVQVQCEGGFEERFLNDVTSRGIALWNVVNDGERLRFCCAASEYRLLRPSAKKAFMRMRVQRKCGLFFRVYPYRFRLGLLLGALLLCLLLNGLSRRIWIIRIHGNEQVSEQQIRAVLQPLGVYEGGSFASVDLPQLQLTVLQQLPQLTWLTVNLQGSTAVVQVSERTTEAEPPDFRPANIIAACDGVVVQVDAVCGEAMVKVGDAVTKDTLLISGVMDSKVGPLLKRADGVVMARTTRIVSVSVPFEERVPSHTPYTVSCPCVYFLGWEIPLYTSVAMPSGYRTYIDRYPLTVTKQTLPVGVEVTRFVYEGEEIRYRDAQAATAEAKARLEQQLSAFGEAVKVEQQTVTVQQTEDGVTVVGVYVCVEPIGVVQPMEVLDKKR